MIAASKKEPQPAATDPLWDAITTLQKAQEDLDGARDTADAQFDWYPAGEADVEHYAEAMTWIRMIKNRVVSAQRLIEKAAAAKPREAARKGAAK